MAGILTPCCPLCNCPPGLVLAGGEQAWCGNDDCTLICWTPTKTLDENLMDAGVVQLPWAEDGTDD